MKKFALLLLLLPFFCGAMPSNLTDREYEKFSEVSDGSTSIRVKLSDDSYTGLDTRYFKLNQTTPQTLSGGAFAGSGLLKLTTGLLGVDTNIYGIAWTAAGDSGTPFLVGDSAETVTLKGAGINSVSAGGNVWTVTGTEVDGSITNELPIAGNLIDISGSPASTVDVDLTEAEGVTWGGGGNPSITWTWNTSSTDTAMTWSAGNVGIGTTSPGFGSDVYGGKFLTLYESAGARGVFELASLLTANNAQAGVLAFVNNKNGNTSAATRNPIAWIDAVIVTTDANADLDSGGSLRFITKPEAGATGETRMIIDSAGYVGIGTTDPARILHVEQSGLFARFVDTATSATTSGGVLELINNDGAALNSGHRMGAINLGAATDASNTVALGARIAAIAAAQWSSTERASHLTFATVNGTTETEVLRITNTGNVGIGTTTPASVLEVSKDWSGASATNLMATFTGYADSPRFVIRRANGTAASPTQTLSGEVLGQLQFRGYNSGGAFNTLNSAAVYAAAEENHTSANQAAYLAFATEATALSGTGGTEKMRITGVGNVGIGWTTPTARLHLPAGTATASSAPLKLTAGIVNTTPESGAVEWSADALYITDSAASRKEIYKQAGTDVAVTDGGTGRSAWTLYDIPYASATTTLVGVPIGTAAQVLSVNASANGYVWTAQAAAGGGNNWTAAADSGTPFLVGDAAETVTLKGTAAAGISTTAAANTWTIVQSKADTTTNGYLWSTDWNTFNAKQAALTLPMVYGDGRTAAGTFSRDLTAVAADQAITGTGFLPTHIIIFGGINGAATSTWGEADSGLTMGHMSYPNLGNGSSNYYINGSYVCTLTTGSGVGQYATIKSMDANGFTITWAKGGSPTGTATLYYVAYR